MTKYNKFEKCGKKWQVWQSATKCDKYDKMRQNMTKDVKTWPSMTNMMNIRKHYKDDKMQQKFYKILFVCMFVCRHLAWIHNIYVLSWWYWIKLSGLSKLCLRDMSINCLYYGAIPGPCWDDVRTMYSLALLPD